MQKPAINLASEPLHEAEIVRTRKSRGRRRLPPIWVWVVFAACAIGVIWIRRPETPDKAFANVTTLILSFVAGMSLLVWFSFLSAFPRRTRLTPVILLVALVASALALLRIDSVNGELVPAFRLRWSAKPDELLGKAQTQRLPAGVDLSRTTESDFSQFLGPKRDASAPAEPIDVERPPKLLWKQKIGAGWSAFAVVGDFAVTLEQRGEEELVTCYRASTGDLLWVYAAMARHTSTLGGTGPRSTPTIHEGKVYALGATGLLHCLDGSTGRRLWERNLHKEYGLTEAEDLRNVAWGRAGSPLIVDKMVVVPAGGKPDRPPVSLVAYDKDTGKKIWEGGSRQIAFASPCLTTIGGARQIVIVNEDNVTGHDPKTGKVLWAHPWPGTSNMDANASQAVPIGDDRLFVSKGYSGGASVFVVERKGDAWNTREIWNKKNILKTKFTNVAILNGFAYGLSDGILECVNVADGERRWKRGRYGHGQVLRVGDVLIVQAEIGEVALVEASSERYVELMRFQAIEGKSWNNPALSGRRLLVRNGEEAACYEFFAPKNVNPDSAQAANLRE